MDNLVQTVYAPIFVLYTCNVFKTELLQKGSSRMVTQKIVKNHKNVIYDDSLHAKPYLDTM